MIDQNGTISENGVIKAQLQLVTDNDARRVQLYSPAGYFLCECPFDGDDDKGFEMGQALYLGYHAGWVNADVAFSHAVHEAINKTFPLEV